MKELTENSKKWRSGKFHRGAVVALLGGVVAMSISLVLTACQSSAPQHAEKSQTSNATGAPNYETDIAPLLKQKCSNCHGFLIAEKGLRLNSLGNILKGGESGPAVVPGSPQNSPLYTALSLPSTDVKHMPPLASGPDLTAAQKKLLGDWITAGAN